MQASIKNVLQLTAVYTVITLAGMCTLALRTLSLGYLLNFNRRTILPPVSRFCLWLVGIKAILPPNDFGIPKKTLFTFNHNSYLDVLILAAMGLVNTRFVISEKTLRLIPVTLVVLGIGGIYIPMQQRKNRRLRFFKNLAAHISKKEYSIAASSEGVHNHHHGIDRFNRGIYHLATVSQMRIVPLFISIPEESNPFSKYRNFKRGLVKVELMPSIETTHWKVDEVDVNKDLVRTEFVKKFNTAHNTAIS